MILDKEQLLKERLPELLVPFDGGEVRIRALSRWDALRLRAAGEEDAESICLSSGLLEPAITQEEAVMLLKGSTGPDLQPIVDAILGMTKLEEGAQKSGRAGPDDR